MEQLLKIRTNEIDADEDGNEWTLHYVLYRDTDDDGREYFLMFEDDGRGNGVEVCRSHTLKSIRHMMFRLGEFVEYQSVAA